MDWTVLLVLGPVFGIICAVVAGKKRRSAAGWFFAGLFFGLPALIAIALTSTKQS